MLFGLPLPHVFCEVSNPRQSVSEDDQALDTEEPVPLDLAQLPPDEGVSSLFVLRVAIDLMSALWLTDPVLRAVRPPRRRPLPSRRWRA